MPVLPIEPIGFDVSHEHRFLVDRFAFQLQAQCFSHRAGAAVASDQEVDSYGFPSRKRSVYTILILPEIDDRSFELYPATQSVKTFAEERLGARLRNHPQVRIRGAHGRRLGGAERPPAD